MVKDRWAESGGVKSGREGITVERRGTKRPERVRGDAEKSN